MTQTIKIPDIDPTKISKLTFNLQTGLGASLTIEFTDRSPLVLEAPLELSGELLAIFQAMPWNQKA